MSTVGPAWWVVASPGVRSVDWSGNMVTGHWSHVDITCISHPRYCGEVCRMKGWEEHKMECSFIGQEGAGGRVLNDQLRLVAR